ncbi:hypothetical protein TNCV_3342871 [Trichonephila clavipes]|nr:hypothetical protein TNCV_3342871 [Trichonephila clavipes]
MVTPTLMSNEATIYLILAEVAVHWHAIVATTLVQGTAPVPHQIIQDCLSKTDVDKLRQRAKSGDLDLVTGPRGEWLVSSSSELNVNSLVYSVFGPQQKRLIRSDALPSLFRPLLPTHNADADSFYYGKQSVSDIKNGE